MLPAWAEKMRSVFRSATISQFILYGNIEDVIPHDAGGHCVYMPLKQYLTEILFSPFDSVVFYDKGRGIQVPKGAVSFQAFMNTRNRLMGAAEAHLNSSAVQPGLQANYPMPATQALDLLDRFLTLVSSKYSQQNKSFAKSAAIVLDYANFILPRGEPLHYSGELGGNLIKILDWAENPAINSANIVTLLISGNLNDLNPTIVENPYNAKIEIPLPDLAEIRQYLEWLASTEPNLKKMCTLPGDEMAQRLTGLSRIQIRNLLLQAVRNERLVTVEYLIQGRKERIEKEAAGRMEFIETNLNLDSVAGHDAVIEWLRDDSDLIRSGKTAHVLPMGYLISGRIGTGKSHLVECFAGSCSIPCAVLKNFRERWVGATESNLERIFHILKALGQVVVFIDEADQLAGHRQSQSGDTGVSGRIYGMLAKEMANTQNRGKIIWMFATSRPDLLEVDLKRQGRLDVHLSLFPSSDKAVIGRLARIIGRKLNISPAKLKQLNLEFDEPVTGSEVEGLLVRAARQWELDRLKGRKRAFKQIVQTVLSDFRPAAPAIKLEYMDLIAVKECTDVRFLPERFRELSQEELDQRINRLNDLITRI